MSTGIDIFKESYLFTLHNMCGEYTVWLENNIEKGSLSYTIKVGDANRDLEYENPPDRALPYLQEICDTAFKSNWGFDELRDKLEKFGDPHYSPIPWEQAPLPKGAIE